MNIEFRDALTSQADALSDLAIESKGHWSYSQAQLDIWRKDLRVEAEDIVKHSVHTVYADQQLIGFFAIKQEQEEDYLDHLWLLPAFIGKGIGKLTFEKVIVCCIDLGIETFTIISDPNAEGFYLKQGAKRVGEVESIPQTRMLPKLRYRIK